MYGYECGRQDCNSFQPDLLLACLLAGTKSLTGPHFRAVNETLFKRVIRLSFLNGPLSINTRELGKCGPAELNGFKADSYIKGPGPTRIQRSITTTSPDVRATGARRAIMFLLSVARSSHRALTSSWLAASQVKRMRSMRVAGTEL